MGGLFPTPLRDKFCYPSSRASGSTDGGISPPDGVSSSDGTERESSRRPIQCSNKYTAQ